MAFVQPTQTLRATSGRRPTGTPWLATYADIDEQAASLDGWNQSYQQLSRGRFGGAVQRLRLDGVGLFIEDLQQAVYQTGQVQPQVVALGVPVVLEGESCFCGQLGDARSLHVFSGRDGFEFRSPKRHLMLGIEVDVGLFESHVLDPSVGNAARVASRARLHASDPAALASLRRFLTELFRQAAADPDGLAGEARQGIVREQLMARLTAALVPVNGPSGAVAAPARACQVALADRARQVVASRLDEPLTVADLCQVLGVSRRSLQNCFQATWGMGPLQWLNTLRLNAVRRRLRDAASVTEAATEFGFWHFGHFAGDYRALFGELPSQTLQRSRAQQAHVHH